MAGSRGIRRGIVRRVTVSEAEAPSAVTVSSPDLLRAARVVRALQGALEAALWAIVAGSVLAFGSVHAWAYSILWVACFLAALIALLRAVAVGGLRQRLGAHRVALHGSSRWLVVEPHPADRALGWSIDLREPALPRGPLLLPGLAFLALALLQLAPLGGGPVTLAPEATRRGITFVLAFLLLHQSAAAAFAHSPARRRFRAMLAWLGAALALIALAQLASGTKLAYGFFESLEGGLPYGPFVNRNHFAGYMLLVLPMALGLLADAWRAYSRRVGDNPNARRSLVGLQTREGTRLVYAALPPLLGIGALLASTSRGGILAFFAALGIAAAGVRARKGTPAWAAALVFAASGAHLVRARAAGGALPARVGRRAGTDGGVARVARGDARLALGDGLRLQRLRGGAVAGAGVAAPGGGDALAGGGGGAARHRGAVRLPRAGRPPGARLVPRGPLRLGAAPGGDGGAGALRRPVGRARGPRRGAARPVALRRPRRRADARLRRLRPADPRDPRAVRGARRGGANERRGQVLNLASRREQKGSGLELCLCSRGTIQDLTPRPPRPESLGMTGGLLCFRVGFRMAATPIDTHRRTRCASHPSVPS